MTPRPTCISEAIADARQKNADRGGKPRSSPSGAIRPALDERDVEAVGAGPLRAHLDPVGGAAHPLGDGRRQVEGAEREVVATRRQPRHRRVVLLRQERAGDVDDPPAWPRQARRPVEHRLLLGDAGREAAGAQAPLGVRVAPPGAGAGAGRVDQHEVGAAVEVGHHVGPARIAPSRAATRRAHLGPGAGPAQALVDRREAARIAVGGDEPALVAHQGGERQGLAAAAGAEVDHRHPGLRAGEPGGELRALVLDLEPAVQEFRLDVEGRAAAVLAERHPQSVRRQRRRFRVEMGQRLPGGVAARLQGVDPDVEGSPAGERPQFRQEVVAESRRQRRHDPFRHVAGDVDGGVGERPGLEAGPLRLGQRGGGEALAGEQLGDRLGGEPALEPQRADQHGAGRVLAHDPGGGGAAAQRVVDERGDGGAVAGAGEAVGEAPILEGVGDRAAALGDVGQDLDGGGEAGARGHRETADPETATVMPRERPDTAKLSARTVPTPWPFVPQGFVSRGRSTARMIRRPIPSALAVSLAALIALSAGACATAPAAPAVDLTPPPPRPYDAKTQLEYGNPPPRAPRY
ncbi:conserved hypothetical protein [Methylobacterium aquaticum]|uniref:Uncharacterized protein n=3 Tax=Methylobacterium TaxID=407 RepID=A0A0C6FA64_9HYPH|nr:conserved hypothetical protein [Methylobacterium aquaticum]